MYLRTTVILPGSIIETGAVVTAGAVLIKCAIQYTYWKRVPAKFIDNRLRELTYSFTVEHDCFFGLMDGEAVLIMAFILRRIKNGIKHTHTGQMLVYRKYLKRESRRLIRLAEDERHFKKRICYYHTKKEVQFARMMSIVQITIRPKERFQFWLDTGLYVSHINHIIDNLAPDYKLIVEYSISDIIKKCNETKSEFCESICYLLKAVLEYIDRICVQIKLCTNETDNDYLEKSLYYFQRMKDEPAASLEEALQRILFWDSLFWQSGHRLMGLGRLDLILNDILLDEDDENTVQIIIDFYKTLHKYYAYKSNVVALGDTGQIIICGGICSDGKYFCNKLSYFFIKAAMICKLPDPKVLLRVSEKMPNELLQIALECISTGIGCPLLSNDDIIIPALKAFGYSHPDACNYITSACWEPLAYGKSLGQNNLVTLNFAKAVNLMCKDNAFVDCETFESILNLYKRILKEQIQLCISHVELIKWEKDPLLSMFYENCWHTDTDISQGGAIYNDYGILSVGLSNAVNSLCNIKRYVFMEKKYMLDQFAICVKENFKNNMEVQTILQNAKYFGDDDEDIIYLTNMIIKYVDDRLNVYRNSYGGKMKWGLSAPAYVEEGRNTGATLDGRCDGNPLAVHISSSQGTAYTKLMNFASQINYMDGCINGNVVDFFITPDFIKDNFIKFIEFLKTSIKVGFFQMQMNCVSSKTLIAAKESPDLFPDLIVRVWGFSAYFNDLPDEYKDVLIKRALENEKAS